MADVTKREMEIRKRIQDRAYKEGVKYGREHGTGAMIDNALEEINHIHKEVRRIKSDISVMFHLQKQSMKNFPEVLAVQEEIRNIIHRQGEHGDAIVNRIDFEQQLGIYEVYKDRHREIITNIAIELMDDLRCKETQDEWLFYFLINYPNEDEGREYLHRLPYCCGDQIVNMGESVASSSSAGGYKEGQINTIANEPEKISEETRHLWGLEWKYGLGEA